MAVSEARLSGRNLCEPGSGHRFNPNNSLDRGASWSGFDGFVVVGEHRVELSVLAGEDPADDRVDEGPLVVTFSFTPVGGSSGGSSARGSMSPPDSTVEPS